MRNEYCALCTIVPILAIKSPDGLAASEFPEVIEAALEQLLPQVWSEQVRIVPTMHEASGRGASKVPTYISSFLLHVS